MASQELFYEISRESREVSSKLLDGGAFIALTITGIMLGHAEFLIGVIPAFVAFRQSFNHNKRVQGIYKNLEAKKG